MHTASNKRDAHGIKTGTKAQRDAHGIKQTRCTRHQNWDQCPTRCTRHQTNAMHTASNKRDAYSIKLLHWKASKIAMHLATKYMGQTMPTTMHKQNNLSPVTRYKGSHVPRYIGTWANIWRSFTHTCSKILTHAEWEHGTKASSKSTGSVSNNSQWGASTGHRGAHARPQRPFKDMTAWKHAVIRFTKNCGCCATASSSPSTSSSTISDSESELEQLEEFEVSSVSVPASTCSPTGSTPGGTSKGAELETSIPTSWRGDLAPRAWGVKGNHPLRIARKTCSCARKAGKTSSLEYLATITSRGSRQRWCPQKRRPTESTSSCNAQDKPVAFKECKE